MAKRRFRRGWVRLGVAMGPKKGPLWDPKLPRVTLSQRVVGALWDPSAALGAAKGDPRLPRVTLSQKPGGYGTQNLSVFTEAQRLTTTTTALAAFLKWSDWHSTVQMGRKGPAGPLIDIGLPRVPLMLSPTLP